MSGEKRETLPLQVRAESVHSLETGLERERRIPTPVTDAEKERRFAEALDRLSLAALASSETDEVLLKVLEVFVDVAGAAVGVVRLRDGDLLRTRAAVGLEGEVAVGLAIPFAEGLPEESAPATGSVFVSTCASDACRGVYLNSEQLRRVYCLPLVRDREVSGIIYLGTKGDHDLSAGHRHFLGELAARAELAVCRVSEYDTLRQEIRARDDVLGVVAHDLRNPINIVALAANSLLQRLPDFSARKPIERILRAAQRADRLIQDLLEVNAIECGQFVIETRTVEIAETILLALESQESLVADASIILAKDLSPGLPPVDVDEERVFEVLENLIGNAVKFTKAGGTVTVGASAREGEVLLWVKDTGPGMPEEQVTHLFDRFWQARRSDRRGSGLGLTICKAIVEAHGGRVWADSQVGTGTTMFFTLPAVLRGVKDEPKERANILLVDDRPENLVALRAILERPDYRLVTARSGEEALTLVLREEFSVALVDIAMPGMDGFQVAAHLKALDRSRDIPIVFVTAFGDDPEEVHRAYSAGCADYLVKPLAPEIVRKKVAVFVDLSHKRRSSRPPKN